MFHNAVDPCCCGFLHHNNTSAMTITCQVADGQHQLLAENFDCSLGASHNPVQNCITIFLFLHAPLLTDTFALQMAAGLRSTG
jgi:hypothetical protein